jgi:hypothetical protein
MMTTMTITKGVDNHDVEDPPRGRKIREEGQVEEEGLASAKEVRHAAVQVHNGNAAFPLMAEATVMTPITVSSTIALVASSLSGAGTMTIIPGSLSPQQCPG